MLSSALVVFREVFEIVLILGIVLAATREMAGRARWLGLGFLGGFGGAVMVAVFTDAISGFAEGMGQEVFNAFVLFTAALFIGWTVLWMQQHARDMKRQFTEVGEAVAAGKASGYALSAVIALALLREGSEIVLFSYGMLAAGQSLFDLLVGGAIGLIGGLVIGGLIYVGLLRLSTRHFFRVTSWLLIFLVAGMLSQGVGFLIAAGYLDSVSQTVWDSSWLLTEGSVVGQSLQALAGYTARPALIQLIVYALTIGVFIILLRHIPARNMPKSTPVSS